MAGRIHPVDDDAPGWVWAPVPVTVTWDAGDPLAVVISADDVDWTVDRDLLAEGLDRSVGLGDVMVCPEPPAETMTRSTRTQIVLRVQSDDRSERGVLTVTTRTMREVLDATYAEVPSGELAEDLIDAELAYLLGRDEPADGEPSARRDA